MVSFLILVARVIAWISSLFHLGSGGTWPGEIALRIDPHILSKLLNRVQKGIIIVAGTNGKTTTSLLIQTILTHSGYKVVHNNTGANLENGIISSLLLSPISDYAVFEVDENVLSKVISNFKCQMTNVINEYHTKQPVIYIILLNLFRDQLDRYGEVDSIAKKWLSSLRDIQTNTDVFINVDDPQLSYIGTQLTSNVHAFGLGNVIYERKSMQHATDSIWCPSCGERLTYNSIYYSHLGRFVCSHCSFKQQVLEQKSGLFKSPLLGIYNEYNVLASTFVSEKIGLKKSDIQQALDTFQPAFGRQEKLSIDGKQIRILLSKNPTGLNESIRTVIESHELGPILFALNDRIPDGKDVSWIWDVDFEDLENYEYPIFASGDRSWDLGIRLQYALTKLQSTNSKLQTNSKYSPISKFTEGQSKSNTPFKYQNTYKDQYVVIENLSKAIQSALLLTEKNETLWILPTYSAMLNVRQILLGRKIL
jgi:lipid II isoglutaminyl synthase (glutamine-hydrolysing)